MNSPARAELMRRLMAPRSVALIGASTDPSKLAGRPVAYMARLGFQGAVYPIAPHLENIHGLRCYPDLEAVPGEIEAALISRPAEAVLDEVRKCLRRGIRAFVVLSGGFAEAGPEGAVLQEQLVAMCREAGAVLCGPNSAGLYNAPTRTTLTLSSNLDKEVADGGSIALLSNSGSIATMCFQNHGHIYRRFVATGNEAVLSVADFMRDAIEDPGVRGVVAFLETIRDPAGLRAAAKRAAELGKPIAVLKAGRTSEGASVARSHTGALVDDDAVIDAVFDEANIIRLRSIAELKAMATLMHALPEKPIGARIGVVTPSGGTAVLITDELLALGMALPPLSEETVAAINRLIPNATASNPLDVTGFGADPVLFGQAVTVLAGDTGLDVILAPMGGAVGPIAQGRAEALTAAARATGKLVVPIWQSSTVGQAGYQGLREAAMPVLTEYDIACRCVAALVEHGARKPAAAALPRTLPAAAGSLLAQQMERREAAVLDEPTVKALLAASGIAVPANVRLDGAGQLERAAGMPFPAVLKIVSRDITHKSAAGGVAVVQRHEDLAAAMDTMRADVARRAPGGCVDGYLLEQLVPGGIELLVGVKHDARFGMAISLGLGGVLANDLGRPVTAMLPLSTDTASRVVRKFSPTLATGAYAMPLCDLLLAVGALAQAWGPRLQVLEINPVKLVIEGGAARAWALDGLLETTA